MSTDTENVEESTETSALEALDEWYHIPVLGAVMLFMVWVRTQAYENVAMVDGNPRLGGVDSWYHWRTVQWTAENYPYTMPYDIWTSFPTGRYVGQFGTLFDQILVTAAMIVGLGDPTTETLYTVSLYMVPVLAALVAIPVFYMGRRLGGTIGGVVSVLILALLPGRFLVQSTIGQLQHHVAEVLFMAIAVLAMMVALRAAEREQPVYELLVDKDWATLRSPTLYSALAGVALTLYIWVWPPAVVLVGILAVFFTVQLCLEYVRGRSPEHTAFVGAVSLGTAALLTALLIEEPGTSVTSFSYIQPLSAALVAGGCVFMAWFARQWNQHGLERRYYPGAIAGLIAATFLVMWLVLPDLFSTLVDNATRRVVPFADAGTDATIQEAQSPPNFATHVFNETGAAFFTMLLGIGLLLARPFFDREYRTEHTLVIVWALFLTSMAATQVRFAYYLVLPVAVINAAFVADVIRFFDFDLESGVNSLREIETYQAIVGLIIVIVLFVPLLTPMGAATAMDRGGVTAPSGDSILWEDSNDWLAENTPEQGDWGGADNSSQFDLYGTYEYPENENYDYPVGSYGIMSWWDYGHLITTQGERAPHSNPFQSGATSSSAFLTAESEERGELVLDSIAAGESPGDESDAELEAMAENATHEEMRYVMIDDSMAGGKFTAIAQWTEPEWQAYFEQQNVLVGENEIASYAGNDRYQDTMVSSLYLEDADGLEHYRLVHETAQFSIVGAGVEIDERSGQVIPQMSTADRLRADWNSWNDVEELAGQVEMANQTNQAIPFDEDGTYYHNAQITSSLKTFERVDGATFTGAVDDDELADENATVTAAVDLETGTDRPFTYTQEVDLADDGTFELTVPYATNEERGVDDGYTNSSVAAADDYEITVSTTDGDETLVYYEGQTDVPESAVLDGEQLEVTLEEVDEPEEAEEPAEDDVDADDADEGDLEDVDDAEIDAETNDDDPEATLGPVGVSS